MGKTVALLLIQLKSVLKQWKLLLASFLVPIMLTFGVVLVVINVVKPDEDANPIPVAIVDHEKSMETGYIIEHMTSAEHIQSLLSVEMTTEEEAFQLLEDNEITAIMIIPEKFSRDLAVGINTPVKVVGNSQRPFQSQLVRYFMESASQFISAAQSGVNTVDAYLREADAPKDLVRQAFTSSIVDFTFHALGRNDLYEQEQVDELHTADLKQYYAGSVLIAIIMIWAFSSLWLTRSSIDETLLRRLLISGVTTSHRFKGRLLATSCMVWGETALLYPVLHWSQLFSNSLTILLFLMVIGFLFITFFLCIEAAINNEKGLLVGSALAMMIFLLLGGHILPPVYLPVWLETASSFIPNYWAMNGYSLILTESEGLTKIIGIIGIFIVGFSLLAYGLEKVRIRRVMS